MKYEQYLKEKALDAIFELYNVKPELEHLQVGVTRKDFEGDFTIVCFPLLKYSKKNPDQTAEELGNYLVKNNPELESFNKIKGFLNLSFAKDFWISEFNKAYDQEFFGFIKPSNNSEKIVVEYSSPNTNKPLHLGHIRNNLIGFSISRILEAAGNNIIKTNIVNDRGIHICKSMIAWKKWGNGETPESSKIKGDFLVGKYYVKFDQEYKNELQILISQGQTKEEAEKNSTLMAETREMLINWENGDTETIDLWKTMNSWVYAGFDVTYKRLGVDFDKIYYESDTYKLGKDIVLDSLKQNKLEQNEDGSVWANLEGDGLDKKLLLRSDGTSVYMTQDIGTAVIRHKDFKFDSHIYVVGNEQDYHFKVLKLILGKMGYEWAQQIYHLSYGMVELPEGKMKSREGTVVDADDLMEVMNQTARQISQELGKLDGLAADEIDNIIETIAMAALKYFLLKVDPKKNMVFNPRESIDFNGNTGPFVQYTYARIQSVKSKAKGLQIQYNETIKDVELDKIEIRLLKSIQFFPDIIYQAAEELNPAVVANYIYELVKEYNLFYHDCPILKEPEPEPELMKFRLQISELCGKIIKNGFYLLGIGVPERM
jgi:arginyl-tRNA synthetase